MSGSLAPLVIVITLKTLVDLRASHLVLVLKNLNIARSTRSSRSRCSRAADARGATRKPPGSDETGG